MDFEISIIMTLISAITIALAVTGLVLYIVWSIIWKIYEWCILYSFHKKIEKIGKEVLEESRKNFLTNLRKTRKIKYQGVKNNNV